MRSSALSSSRSARGWLRTRSRPCRRHWCSSLPPRSYRGEDERSRLFGLGPPSFLALSASPGPSRRCCTSDQRAENRPTMRWAPFFQQPSWVSFRPCSGLCLLTASSSGPNLRPSRTAHLGRQKSNNRSPHVDRVHIDVKPDGTARIGGFQLSQRRSNHLLHGMQPRMGFDQDLTAVTASNPRDGGANWS